MIVVVVAVVVVVVVVVVVIIVVVVVVIVQSRFVFQDCRLRAINTIKRCVATKLSWHQFKVS